MNFQGSAVPSMVATVVSSVVDSPHPIGLASELIHGASHGPPVSSN